jgi:hypothetical protein
LHALDPDPLDLVCDFSLTYDVRTQFLALLKVEFSLQQDPTPRTTVAKIVMDRTNPNVEVTPFVVFKIKGPFVHSLEKRLFAGPLLVASLY